MVEKSAACDAAFSIQARSLAASAWSLLGFATRTAVRGQSTTLGAYTLTYVGSEVKQEPNREATIARFDVTKNGKALTTLEPRMNQYPAMREPIGTPAVYSTIKGDLYVSIMNLDGNTAGILVLWMPMVGWIWFAVMLMGIGGLVALIPSRRVIASEARDPLPARDASALRASA